MKKAIYPGSFDPVTLGHIDVIRRASKLFDHLIIGVLNNRAKTPLFSVEERVKMLKEVTKDIPNVEVKSFAGLTVDFAKECGANAVVRGLRAITDFEYELQIAQLNRVMDEYRYSIPHDKSRVRVFKFQYRERGSGLRRRYFKFCNALCGG